MGMSMEKLLKEKEAYGELRSKLLEGFKGKWVAICNGGVVAQGDDFGEVVKRAYEVTGGEVFYVTKVGEEQRVERRVYRNR
ncbi:MAG: hypothetical protein AOA65_0226 [Candidatus Bathyarchaeota archaeon BA1]|nr:MAG: hypothetical protein AOA65_0226 [Candidatus Bathyarchaeota archaeon BA1]